MSQERLAEQLGITFQQLQKYERGNNRVSASRLHQISKMLQVPITFFFDGTYSDAGEPEAMTTRASRISEALSDPATVRLLRAFARIEDPQVKKKAVGVIEAIAETSGEDAEPGRM